MDRSLTLLNVLVFGMMVEGFILLPASALTQLALPGSMSLALVAVAYRGRVRPPNVAHVAVA